MEVIFIVLFFGAVIADDQGLLCKPQSCAAKAAQTQKK